MRARMTEPSPLGLEFERRSRLDVWGNEWRFCEVCLLFGQGERRGTKNVRPEGLHVSVPTKKQAGKLVGNGPTNPN